MKQAENYITLALCFTALSLQAKHISIENAIKENLVSAEVTCKGGLCVNYLLKNKTKDSLVLLMPAGWRMNSVKDEYQDILVVQEKILALGGSEKKSFEIKGYCCEATHSAPVSGIKYDYGKMAEPALLQVAAYLSKHRADESTEQYAVWAVSDNKPTANITGQNDSLTTSLRNFVAGIKGEPLPWYTLQKKVMIGPDGIREYPIRLRATVGYSVDKESYAWFFVTDSLGHKVGQITGQWLTPGKHDYAVNLDVREFKKGKYKISLSGKEAEFISKEFEI